MICSIELFAKGKEAKALAEKEAKERAEKEAKERALAEKEATKNAELYCETFVNDALLEVLNKDDKIINWIEYTGNDSSYCCSEDRMPTVSIVFGLPYSERCNIELGKTALMFPLRPNCNYADGTQSYCCNTNSPLNFQHFINYLKNACYEVNYETGYEYRDYGFGRQSSVTITIRPGIPKCL